MHFQGCNNEKSKKCKSSNRANRCFDNLCFCGNERECQGFSRCRELDQNIAIDNSPAASCQIGKCFNFVIMELSLNNNNEATSVSGMFLHTYKF